MTSYEEITERVGGNLTAGDVPDLLAKLSRARVPLQQDAELARAAVEEMRAEWEARVEREAEATAKVAETDAAIREARRMYAVWRALTEVDGPMGLPPYVRTAYRHAVEREHAYTNPWRTHRLAAFSADGDGLYRRKTRSTVWWYLLRPGAAELESWEDTRRGRTSPKPPPAGGRWRHLKITDDELRELTAET